MSNNDIECSSSTVSFQMKRTDRSLRVLLWEFQDWNLDQNWVWGGTFQFAPLPPGFPLSITSWFSHLQSHATLPLPFVYSSNCLNHESHLRFVLTHLLVQISQIFEPVSDNLTQITFAWLAAQIEEATEVNLWWQPVNLICSLFKNLLHPKKTICYQAVTFWPMVSHKDTRSCQNEICQESKP